MIRVAREKEREDKREENKEKVGSRKNSYTRTSVTVVVDVVPMTRLRLIPSR